MIDLKDLYFFGEINKEVIGCGEFDSKEIKTYHYGMVKGNWNYVLIKKNEIIYIGATSSFAQRILTHKRHFNFDKVICFKYKNRKSAFYWETTLIKCFKPKYNFRSR
jgi:23S rRNA C2498 (ribose-2'-O)-methylase RlmM